MNHVPSVTENSSLWDVGQTGSKHVAGQLQKFYEKVEIKLRTCAFGNLHRYHHKLDISQFQVSTVHYDSQSLLLAD